MCTTRITYAYNNCDIYTYKCVVHICGSLSDSLHDIIANQFPQFYIILVGPPKGGSGAMCYVQKSLACYVLCKFLFTLLCEIQIGCYAEVQPVLCAM